MQLKLSRAFFFLIGLLLGGFFLTSSFYFIWGKTYDGRVFPEVTVGNVNLGSKNLNEVEGFFSQKNSQLENKSLTFVFEDKISTISAKEINWGYDAKTIAVQAYSIGRSGGFFTQAYQRITAWRDGFSITPAFTYDDAKLTSFLEKLAQKIDTPPQDALFNFQNSKVTAFRLSKNGQKLDIDAAKISLSQYFSLLNSVDNKQSTEPIIILLSVQRVEPKVSDEKANGFGIRELVGRGTSRFLGSILNRVHNITLAASRLNGVMVAPGEEFSFNNALGDVSKLTGYKEAYVIKDGRTVLGDGGGVCQVSTTFFRALLNAGLPIIERHPHSYRVGYYEQDSPVGFDASVYAPSWDLKFRNDTGNYLLIQSFVNPATMTLTFELYGTTDGRQVVISKPVIANQTPPPDDLYQDDPTLPKGQIKQIDWKAWGADVSFSRTVTKKGQILISETFKSHYQPWQAVFLRGTKE